LDQVSATRRDVSPNPSGGQNLQTNAPQQSEVKKEPVKVAKKPGRNDKVEIRDLKTGETKVVKFKVAEPKVDQGFWEVLRVVND